MTKKYNKKAEFVMAVVCCVICLVMIGFGVWGMIVDGKLGRLWFTLVAGGIGGLLLGLVFLFDALGVIDYFIN